MIRELLYPCLGPLLLLVTLSSAIAEDKVLVLLNSRNEMNLTARFAKEGVRLGQLVQKQASRKPPAFIFVDFDDSVILAAQQIEAAIQTHKPIAMLGTIRSDHAVIVADIAEKQKIPFLAPLSTNPRVTDGRSYTLRTCFDDKQQAKLLARYVTQERGRRRVAILYNQSQVFPVGFNSLIRESLNLHHGVALWSKGYDSQKDIEGIVSDELKSFKPDAVVLPAYQTEAAGILNQLIRGLPPEVEYFGPDSWGGGRLFSALLEARSRGKPRAFYAEHWSKELSSSSNQRFLSLYRKHPPTARELRTENSADLAPIAAFFEATDFLLTAWNRSSATESLVTTLQRLKYLGPRGPIHLESSPNPKKPLYLFEVATDGARFLGTYSEKGWTLP